ncbi:MAG: MFS transporter [Gammaproteobacteria bacterium]|nr:MFS transporter [Gammaproteobacteria bacterium]
MSSMGAKIDQLPVRLKLAWGTGALGSAVLMNSVTILILYYLVSVVRLDPGIAGTLVFISKLVDVATDPIMGMISDRVKFRRGRRRPFLVFGAFLSALSFAMLFTIPEFSSQTITSIYVLGVLVLYTLGYTIFNVPYMAMPAEMTDGYHERSSLHSYRVVFISVGSSIAGALAPILLQVFGEGREAYRVVAILFAGIIFASMVACYFGTREARFTYSTRSIHSVGVQVKLVLTNKPFMWLIATKALQLLGIASIGATTLFFITAYLRIDLANLAVFALINTIVTILMMPVFVKLSRHIGKRNGYMVSTVIFIIYCLSWIPAGPGEPLIWYYARAVLVGMCLGGNILLANSMLTDTIDLDARRSGMRREGTYAAMYSFVEKFSGAFGPLLVGWILAYVGFNRDLPRDAVQEPQVLFGILMGVSLIPAALALLSMITLAFYRLDQKMLKNATAEPVAGLPEEANAATRPATGPLA